MRLPPQPHVPLAELSDDELVSLFSKLGHVGKRAQRRALALLPEIIRRGLYRRAGFASPIDFACRKLEVSRDTVRRVLSLHESIGHMPPLWDLLASGDESWSKLEVVAGVATPDTAGWWADLVRRCSRDELAEYVRRHKAQQKAEAEAEAARATLWGGGVESGSPLAPPEASGPGRGPDDRRVSERTTGSCERASNAESQPVTAEGVDPADLPREAKAAGDDSDGSDRPVDPADPLRETNSAGDDAFASGRSSSIPGLFGEIEAGVGPRLRAVTLYLEPEVDDLLRAFQVQIRRQHGQTVSLGELVGMLLRGHLPGMRLVTPLSDADGRAASGGRQAIADSMGEPAPFPVGESSPSPVDVSAPCPVGEPTSDPMAESAVGSGVEPVAGAVDATFPGTTGKPAHGPVVESDPGPGGVASGLAGAGALAAAGLAIGARRVEVVVRIAEAGENWSRRLVGPMPAGIAEAFRAQDAVVMGDLYVEAVRAASRAKGDGIPAAVRRFVALRAGLRCETGGCQRPLHDIDHVVARAEGGGHHPDNLRARCKLHHGVKHQELFGDAEAGTVVSPGAPARSGLADRAYQAARKRAVSRGGMYRVPASGPRSGVAQARVRSGVMRPNRTLLRSPSGGRVTPDVEPAKEA